MITFRPYQNQCIHSFFDYYENGAGGNGLVVVPTAGGKSLIIGGLATKICKEWPGQRILILSHVSELIAQNHSKILLCDRNASTGIYAAGLGRREVDVDILVASVQSVYKKGELIGHVDLVFVDEAHLIQFGSIGMYGQLINQLKIINKNIKLCGFTATDYRLDGGLLTEGEGSLFDDVIIEIPIKYLLEEGYLTPPISKSSLVQADLEGVARIGREFNIKQMAERFDQKAFMNAALDADMPFLENRHSIAIFCATLENAAHVADGLLERGIDCEVIDGEMNMEDREDRLERFRSGELRALASVGVITTGTDIPNIDTIILFRATESPGLYQQIIGRGFRVVYADGYDITARQGRLDAIRNGAKPNFLVLDHGGNIERHGPITSVQKPRRREKGERAPKAPPSKVRICEICRSAWPLEATHCGLCNHQLTVDRDPTQNLNIEASDESVLGDEFMRGEIAKWFNVDDVRYRRHKRRGAPDHEPEIMQVIYYCGTMQFSEWISFHGYRRKFSMGWWGVRTIKELPATVNDALPIAQTLKMPLQIQIVKRDGNYSVIRHTFNKVYET